MKIACFIYHDFQQFSDLAHTPFQELLGDVGSCLAPQIGRLDVENLDSKNPEIYHDFLQFSGKNPVSYHVFRTFPGANPDFCHVFLPFSGKNSQTCHVLLTFSGENPLIFHDFQTSLGCLRLQVRRIQIFSLQLEDDRAAAAIWKLEILWWQAQLGGTGLQLQSGISRFFGGRPSWKATGLQLQSGNSRFLVVGPVGRRHGYNCNLGTRDFWWQAQLEGDTATTAIWELEIFGGRPSWKATGLQLQSGNSRFFGGRPS